MDKSVLPKKGRLVKGTEESKQRMAELRTIKQQKKIGVEQRTQSVSQAKPPLEKPKKRQLKPM